jgi:hypothetical protein
MEIVYSIEVLLYDMNKRTCHQVLDAVGNMDDIAEDLYDTIDNNVRLFKGERELEDCYQMIEAILDDMEPMTITHKDGTYLTIEVEEEWY